MTSEIAVCFDCQGQCLLGVMHEPVVPARNIIVVMVVGGPQYRVGSHRQFVLMARRFAAAGYPVLRFDYRGMGDSDGEPQGFEYVDADIGAAIDAATNFSPGARGVVLFGLCDAASALLMYASRGDARVLGMLLANPWVRSPAGEAKAYIRHYYGRRLLQRSFWSKVVSGKVSGIASVKSFLTQWRRARLVKPEVDDTIRTSGSFIERMAAGFEKMRGPIKILLSERDLTAREFEARCETSARWAELTRRGNVQLTPVPDADHTFSSAQSLQAAVDTSIAWLDASVHGQV
jgi:exosortase A-associated hydrolase 1